MASKKAKVKKGKRLARPAAIERAYAASLQALVKACRKPIALVVKRLSADLKALHQRTDAARVDANAEPVTRALAGVAVQLDTVVKKAKPGLLAQGVGKRTAAFAVAAADKAVRGVVEIPTDKIIKGSDQKTFIKQNAALIKSIPKKLLADVAAEAAEAWAVGRDPAIFARRIEERFGVASSRAQLIAQDQISKLNAKVQEKRLTALGSSGYVWDTSRDERVRGRPDGLYPDARPSHWERQGKRFLWSDPPEDGHPGEPIRCRCVAIPVFDDDE